MEIDHKDSDTLPSGTPLFTARVHKTCLPLQRYCPRSVSLFRGGDLYVFLRGMSQPYSRIRIGYSHLSRNPDDEAKGFVLTSKADSRRRQRFTCEDEETAQKLWEELARLAAEVVDDVSLASPVPLRSPASPQFPDARRGSVAESDSLAATQTVGLSRLKSAERPESSMAGTLLKRNLATQAYGVRWCEVWPGVGLAYARKRHADVEAFQVLPLRNVSITVDTAKQRFSLNMEMSVCVEPGQPAPPQRVYFRCDSAADLSRWISALENETGSAAKSDLSPVRPGGRRQSMGVSLRGSGGVDLRGPSVFDDPAAEQAQGELDSDEEYELADLLSPTPLPRMQLELDSVSRTVIVKKDTVGFAEVLDQRLAAIGPYGFHDLLKRFEGRMAMPLCRPFGAVSKHIQVLDLDASLIRTSLSALLAEYAHEMALALVAQKADELLTRYIQVREVYLVRRDIAEFREQKDQHGLRPGINGAIRQIEELTRTKTAATARSDEVLRTERLLQALAVCVEHFRVDFDVFDEAVFTIDDVAAATAKAEAWLDAAHQHKMVDPLRDAAL